MVHDQLERLPLCNGRSSSGSCVGFRCVIEGVVSLLSVPSGRLSEHVVYFLPANIAAFGGISHGLSDRSKDYNNDIVKCVVR